MTNRYRWRAVWYVFGDDGTSLTINPTLIERIERPPVVQFSKLHFLITNKNISIMVTITGFATRQRKDGTNFVVLTITGGIEMVQSQSSGQWRAVIRKCQIPASFDEEVARSVVGSQLPGSIIRVQADPYTFTDEKTGEVITMSHSWSYAPDGVTAVPQPEEVFA